MVRSNHIIPTVIMSVDSEHNKLEDFLLFPELSTEIRAMIWKHSLPMRVVQVFYCTESGVSSLARMPKVLCTISDAFRNARHAYQPAFDSADSSSPTLINFDRDIIFLGLEIQPCMTEFFQLLPERDRNRLQYLAVHEGLVLKNEETDDDEDEESEDEDDILTALIRNKVESLPALQILYEVKEIDDFFGDFSDTILYNPFPDDAFNSYFFTELLYDSLRNTLNLHHERINQIQDMVPYKMEDWQVNKCELMVVWQDCVKFRTQPDRLRRRRGTRMIGPEEVDWVI